MAAAILLAVILVNLCSGDQSMLGPWFSLEPPALVRFAVAGGVRVRCAARGDPPPALTWLLDDGTVLHDVPGLRRIYNNGTLEMVPSSGYPGGGGGGGGGGATTLRCRASNAHGVALSRDVRLQPVSDVSWEAVVSAPAASEGGVAALTCSASRDAELVRVAVWYRGDRVLHVDTPTADSRYVLAGNALLIREARAADAGAYGCLVRHTLTATTKRSAPAHLSIIPGPVTSAPRIVAGGGEVSTPSVQDICLPCVSSEHPPPHYTWYREWEGRLQPVEPTSWSWLWAGGAALCLTRAPPTAAGVWLCKAYNAFGDATAHTTLVIQDSLTVTVKPTVVVADTGSTARFNCNASDPAASLTWLHNGAPAGAGAELVLRGVARAHRGVYQCVARRERDSAQAAAELRLGEFSPELHYTFIEQALRAGGGVSLRCAASGAPPPRFAWLLEAQPLDQRRDQHRYFISQETSVNGDVVSILNISNVVTTDGGRYTCRAQNDLGYAEHSARLNIYGPPSIRALGAVRVVAGANATIYCPYAGYPISSISWWRRGASVALGGTGRVSARGAELRLAPALPADAGHYACAVAAPDGPAARRDIDIQVRNPPKISPFIFSSELTEGSSVQVLCGVSSGDKPMYFSWLKDGSPLPPNLQIEEKSLNEFSLLMFTDLSARHSGDYTCRVSNHAAAVNYTATLGVKVAPAWTTEPLDSAPLLGAPLLVECAARGYPAPTVTWYRRIGDGASLSPDGDQWEQVVGGDWGGAGAMRARNGTLSATTTARAHRGLYRCLADNGVGPPLVKHVNITVHEPAHFEGSSGNLTCVRGRSATLVCRARGDAPLTLHWTHRGNRLDLNSYRWTVSEVRTIDGLRSTLQLHAAERADAGEYRCHARNQFGQSELLIYLQVEEPPDAPSGLRLGGVGRRWVRLVWRGSAGASRYSARYTALHSLPGTEPGHNTVNLTIETPGHDRLIAGGLYTLVSRLEGLRPAAAYSLRIVASNHVGQSPHSEPLLFSTLEEAPTASPQNVRVRPGNTGELHVSWSAPSQDNWNGELLGYVVSWRELDRYEDEAEGEVGEGEGAGRAGSATAPGWSSAELTLPSLRPFVRYVVTLRAYNRAGSGPPSPAVHVTTAGAVPELSPTSVSCEAVSARALRVHWAPLPAAQGHALRGYDLHYAPLHYSTSWSGPVEPQTARAGPDGEASLQGLRAATNYSVWVRARADAGLGPPSPPAYCTTREDVPSAVEAVRALASSVDAVRVTWLAPAQRAGVLTHYTLYIKELGKVGGEWAQRVDAGDEEQEEAWREVRGLRERTVYEFWVRAATAAGAGAPSRPVTAAPAPTFSARIASLNRVVWAVLGGRARLRCSALGAPPLRWRWSPLPHTHSVTDAGDLIIHKVVIQSAGNYTCQVSNDGGSDALVVSLGVRTPPAAPAPRLLRADAHALHLAWDSPPDGGASILGYTVWWVRGEGAPGTVARSKRAAAGDTTLALRGLACGALYRVTLRAYNLVGASPHSRPLLARTIGDRAKPPPGKEFVWSNSTTIRLNLLAWVSRCPVAVWTVALRPTAASTGTTTTAGDWLQLEADAEAAVATNLKPGSWYEIRVVARSPAGDTVALYRAATRANNGERIGEPVEVPVEAQSSTTGGVGTVPASGPAWRTGLAPALLAAGCAALLALLAGVVLVRRRQASWCLRRECSSHQVCQTHPHPQLYSTEPSKRNGKTLTPPDGDLHEISPYATFSMPGGVGGGARGGCALHLHTFGRAESLDLAAPPPRPNLHAHNNEYGRSRDSDSESSGSPCAACAAELYRLPPAHLPDSLPAVESSAEDTSYGAGGRALRSGGSGRQARRARRRREHARHEPQPTVRYFTAASPQPHRELT